MPRTNVEYATDQITVYRSCPYDCKYCWAKLPLFKYRIARGMYDPVEEAKRYLKVKGKRTIVVSFTTDPYPPIEFESNRTRKVLEVLASSHHKVMILTKNPCLALRDIDVMLNGSAEFWLGTTITVIPDSSARMFEPKAPPPSQRIAAIKAAKYLGLKTWISIEPIIPYYTNIYEIIYRTRDFTDFYVFGALNYPTQTLGKQFKKHLKEYYKTIFNIFNLKKPHFIKKELRKYLT